MEAAKDARRSGVGDLAMKACTLSIFCLLLSASVALSETDPIPTESDVLSSVIGQLSKENARLTVALLQTQQLLKSLQAELAKEKAIQKSPGASDIAPPSR